MSRTGGPNLRAGRLACPLGDGLPGGWAFTAGLVLFGVLPFRVDAEPSFFASRVAPVLERHCVTCHGLEKQKAELRLDSFEGLMRGSDAGTVIEAGDVKASELMRRVRLPADDEEVMPSDGKPLLSADEIRILEMWITAGASESQPLSAYPDAPELKPARDEVVPLVADWRPRMKEITALEKEVSVHLVPRSQVPTDGLILRTASAPERCDDAALAKLAPVAELIVEAELARTAITDSGLRALAACKNLRWLDLTRTGITSAGLTALLPLQKLEAINLTETSVDDAGVATLKELPALKKIWSFGSKVTNGARTNTRDQVTSIK